MELNILVEGIDFTNEIDKVNVVIKGDDNDNVVLTMGMDDVHECITAEQIDKLIYLCSTHKSISIVIS